jgi:hypothetical protein
MIWFSTVMLAFEASDVIRSRLSKTAIGDVAETQLMVTEKIGAAFDRCAILASDGDTFKVIECYRKNVAIKAKRFKR